MPWHLEYEYFLGVFEVVSDQPFDQRQINGEGVVSHLRGLRSMPKRFFVKYALVSVRVSECGFLRWHDQDQSGQNDFIGPRHFE